MESCPIEGVQINLIESTEEAAQFMRWLGKRREWLAVDTETGGLSFWKDPLRLVQFGDTETAWVMRWDRWAGVAMEALQKYEENLVGHNVGFDWRYLSHHSGENVSWKNVHDTMNMAHIIDPVKSVALKTRTSSMLSPQAKKLQGALAGAMKAQGWSWSEIPYDFPIYWGYAGFDCILTARLAESYWPRIQSEFSDVYALETEVTRICSNMEQRGTRVDLPYCDKKYKEFNEYCQATEAWCLENYGVMPSENQNVAIALVKDGVDLSKTTASGQWSTDKDVLDGLDHPLARAVLGHRKASKLKQSYFRNFLEMNDHGVLHPSIRTLGARTARMSVREPALQTLPKGPIVRNGFIPRDGMVWVSADFANIEMRLLAHFSGDPGLIEAASTSDMHLTMARIGYEDDTIEKKDPRRQTFKNSNFAQAYCAGTEQFARTAGLDLDSAVKFLDFYNEKFPGVKAFQKNVQNVALARLNQEGQAYIKTPLGRRHPAVRDKIYTLVNFLLQGSAADAFKQSLIDLDMAGFGPYMLLPVHDEQNFELPLDQVDELIPEIVSTMRQDGWAVPLTVDVGSGTSWGESK